MLSTFRQRDLPWVVAWVLASLLGALWLGNSELTRTLLDAHSMARLWLNDSHERVGQLLLQGVPGLAL